MGWAIGYEKHWERDIGYGVPSICDYPHCSEKIDRGLAYVCCNEEPYGGEEGCGLYFCAKHSDYEGKCVRCQNNDKPFKPKPDTKEWVNHKNTHPSWEDWRKEADQAGEIGSEKPAQPTIGATAP